MKNLKQLFLKQTNTLTVQDALHNSLLASLRRNRTYKNGIPHSERVLFRQAIMGKLQEMGTMYSNPVSEELHKNNIVGFSDSFSAEFGHLLVGERFRIGTSQKLLNLFIKFLWCLNDDWPTPPHCPVDNIVLKQANIYGAWTKLDSIELYQDWINRLRIHTHTLNYPSIAEWELAVWSESVQ